MMKKWDELPKDMQNKEVKYYYDILCKKQKSIKAKRVFDVVVSILLIFFLSPLFLVIGMMIKVDSPGPVLYRQIRVTTYGNEFTIFKFRTMVNNADKMGSHVTTKNDSRITRVGHILRKIRLDELPQLFNVLIGDMTFVGTRPEVPKYASCYTDVM